ncbi:hypothetical protein GCM10023149_30770 [Mucilaginibacter gynuensis]|uniref:Uncharacterized protein n=1 Tax=Mucilaginibacter gynuensis TaxID=1302236 RepID=A0ABP8GN28_9SPHI
MKKYRLTWTLSALLIGAVCWAVWERTNRIDNPVVIFKGTGDITAPTVKTYTDSTGAHHTVVQASNSAITKKQLQEHGAKSIPTVDSSAKIMNIAANKIDELTQVNSRLRADSLKAHRTIVEKDRAIIYYKDKWAQIAYHPPVNTADTSDQGTFDLQYDADIKIVKYWQRKRVLGLPIGARKSFLDISSSDPRFTIRGVKHYVAEQPEPSFGLRLQAVSNYSFSRKLLNVGPGLQFDFKRFSLVGSYFYDFDSNQWRPTIGARYDLIRL